MFFRSLGVNPVDGSVVNKHLLPSIRFIRSSGLIKLHLGGIHGHVSFHPDDFITAFLFDSLDDLCGGDDVASFIFHNFIINPTIIRKCVHSRSSRSFALFPKKFHRLKKSITSSTVDPDDSFNMNLAVSLAASSFSYDSFPLFLSAYRNSFPNRDTSFDTVFKIFSSLVDNSLK